MPHPKVSDNDQGEITVTHDGGELRGWSYATEDERRQKMLQAREYVEGWCDGQATMGELKKELLDFEEFLNEPPQYEDRKMVREYRHEAYRKWSKLRDIIQAAMPRVP